MTTNLKVVGNKLYAECFLCHQWVQVNKVVFGSAHFCLPIEERNRRGYP